MITLNDHIKGWNGAGKVLNAEMVGLIFKKLDSPDDVAVHNFLWFQIDMRLQNQGENFKKAITEIIEQLSLRNLEHGTTEKDKTG